MKIFIRDWYLWFVQLIPSWKHQLEMGSRRMGMTTYDYEPGMTFVPGSGGKQLPQVYCKEAGKEDGKVLFTDDIIFGGKKGLFQILVLLDCAEEYEATKEALVGVENGEEATFLVHDPYASKKGIFRIATAAEFAADEVCAGRPVPMHYDEYRLKKEVGKRFVVVRPDRFIFAACDDREGLDEALGKMEAALRGERL